MKRWIRRLRGALGIGTLWGAAGAAVGAVGGAVGALLGGLPLGYIVPMFSAYVGVTTFLLGAGFSLALATSDARGWLGRPTIRRFAQLGAVAGAILPFAWLLLPVGELLTDLTALPTAQFLALLIGASATCAAVGSSLAAATLAAAGGAPESLGDPVDQGLLEEPGSGDSARGVALGIVFVTLVPLLGCEPPLPPGLGDRVVDARFEVVEPGGSEWGIGQDLQLSELEGKPVVLDFWASWCAACSIQHDFVTELKERYGDEIVVVGVLHDDTPENGRVWLRAHGATYPSVVDVSDRLAEQFWVRGLPRFVLLSPDRRLSWDFMGASTSRNPYSTDSVSTRLDAWLNDE